MDFDELLMYSHWFVLVEIQVGIDWRDLLYAERMEVMMLMMREENSSSMRPIYSDIQSIDHVKGVVVIVEYKQ